MKMERIAFLALVSVIPCALLCASIASAATNYVWQGSPNPTPPYLDWDTAAHTIQEAVDAAQSGDTVLVTNGVYSEGGRAVYGTMTNRVAIDKPITVKSVSPGETTIAGAASPGGWNGEGAIRGVYLGTNAILNGFTIRDGHTRTNGNAHLEQSGAGVWCETSAIVTNCTMTWNTAFQFGGGVYQGLLYNCTLSINAAENGGGAYNSRLEDCGLIQNFSRVNGAGAYGCNLYRCSLSLNYAAMPTWLWGSGGGAYSCTLYNCVLTGNSATMDGGGASLCTLYNCTLTSNTAHTGGGAYECTLVNCISYYNTGWSFGTPIDANCDASFVTYSCTTPLPPEGLGNITNEPVFQDRALGDFHLRYGSPGIDAGTNLSEIVSNDLDRLLRPVDGNGDGIIAFDMGAYEFSPHYVWQASPNPSPPYSDWANAAHNLQDAVDCARTGDTVLVTNGIYDLGGRAVYGPMTNRVAIDKAIIMQSLSGPSETIIMGSEDPGSGNGEGAIRCVYLGNNANLIGFTLTNGHTHTNLGIPALMGGGGVYSEAGIVSNCVLTGNSALVGGGSYGGNYYHCTFTANSGGGADHSTIYDTTIAGNVGTGARECTLSNCTLLGNTSDTAAGALFSVLHSCVLASNSASINAGGACFSGLYNCIVLGNRAENGAGTYAGSNYNCKFEGNAALRSGGGSCQSLNFNSMFRDNSAETGGAVYMGSSYNCTIVSNSATMFGGAYGGKFFNCILYFNNAVLAESNYTGSNFYPTSSLNYCCTTPLPPGQGNISAAPTFVNLPAGDFRLRYGSPCIDAGTNLSLLISNDLDGFLRPLDGNADGELQFDIGAYEYNPISADSNTDGIPDWWTLTNGFNPNDDQVASADPDTDFLNNFGEYMAGTDPTNAESRLRIEYFEYSLEGSNATIYFPTVENRLYTMMYCTNLSQGLWTPVPGQTDVNGYGWWLALSDTNATPPRFYRISVRLSQLPNP